MQILCGARGIVRQGRNATPFNPLQLLFSRNKPISHISPPFHFYRICFTWHFIRFCILRQKQRRTFWTTSVTSLPPSRLSYGFGATKERTSCTRLTADFAVRRSDTGHFIYSLLLSTWRCLQTGAPFSTVKCRSTNKYRFLLRLLQGDHGVIIRGKKETVANRPVARQIPRNNEKTVAWQQPAPQWTVRGVITWKPRHARNHRTAVFSVGPCWGVLQYIYNKIMHAKRRSHTKLWKWKCFATLDKAKPDTGNIRGLNLAAVKRTTVQVTRLPL
jgi:hypothetical protein